MSRRRRIGSVFVAVAVGGALFAGSGAASPWSANEGLWREASGNLPAAEVPSFALGADGRGDDVAALLRVAFNGRGKGQGVGPSPGQAGGGERPAAHSNAVGSILEASDRAEEAIVGCGLRFDTAHLCIADALDSYASEIDSATADLPARFHVVPAIVHAAARRVREARTKAEALGALKIAEGQVRKTISLLRAENPNARPAVAEAGRAVNETLGVAREALLRSAEI